MGGIKPLFIGLLGLFCLVISSNVALNAYTFDRATKTLTLASTELVTTPTIAYRAATLHLVVANLSTPLPVNDHTNWGNIFSNYMNILSVNGTDAPWLPYYKRSWKMITVQPTWTNYSTVPPYIKNDVVRVWIPAGTTENTALFTNWKTDALFKNVSEAYYYGTDFDNYATLSNYNLHRLYPPKAPSIQLPSIRGNTLYCNASDLSSLASINGIAAATNIVIYGNLSEDQLKDLKNLRSSPMTALESISLPNNTTNLPAHCFNGCTWLKSFSANRVTSIGTERTFFGCTSLQYISLPEIQTVSTAAFSNCNNLRTVDLPNAQTINNYAFQNCSSLQYISLPSAITLNDNIFSNCTSLRTVDLQKAQVIGSYGYVFSNCTSLTDITFGANITFFGGHIFDGASTTSATLHLLNATEYNKKTSPTEWNGYIFKEILDH